MKKLICLLLLAALSFLSRASCSIYQVTPVTCAGNCDGSVVFTPTGGSAPYFITFDGVINVFTGAYTIPSLCAGAHTYSITDSLTCSDTGSIVVTSPSPLALAATNVMPSSCGNGMVQVVATGGTPPYVYQMNGVPSTTQGSFYNLAPGNYTITVVDANGCTATIVVNVFSSNPVAITYTTIPPSCVTCQDGSISVNATGGTPPYTYIWNTGVTTPTHFQLGVGVYSVCVTDAMGCSTCETIALYDSSYTQISGTVFYDVNSNGTLDSLEPLLSNQRLYILPDSINLYSANGYYSTYLPSGTYTDSLVVPTGWHNTSASSLPFTLGTTSIDHLDFGIYPDNTTSPIVNPCIYPPAPRCNSLRSFYIYAANNGSVLANGVISFTADSSMAYAYSTPVPDSIVGRTYYWSYTNLMYFNSTYIATIGFNLPSAGTILHNAAENRTLDASGNVVDTSSYQLTQTVTCSCDPNDKSVNPPGVNASNDVAPETQLDFTIRFQNTGNDTALVVVIKDTLDENMDLTSLQFLSASHAYTAAVDQQRIMTITFDNIMLPDSTTDEPNSHGYVQYRLTPQANLPDPTSITNTAYIYFDLNSAVATNSTHTTYTQLSTGLYTYASAPALVTYPNPAVNSITVELPATWASNCTVWLTDMSGKKVADYGTISESTFLLHRQGLSAGNYILHAATADGRLSSVSKVAFR